MAVQSSSPLISEPECHNGGDRNGLDAVVFVVATQRHHFRHMLQRQPVARRLREKAEDGVADFRISIDEAKGNQALKALFCGVPLLYVSNYSTYVHIW